MTLRNNVSLSVALLVALGTLSTAADNAGTRPASEEVKARALVNYGKLPLSFEENRGQTDARVKFLSRGSGYTIAMAPSEVLLNLQSAGKAGFRQSAIRMSFPGAKVSPDITGGERQGALSSYFVGNDPARWVAGAPNYARVRYQDLYPGVDLAFYGNQGQLEYDFVIAPGADPKDIRLQFDGVAGMRVDPAGDLVLSVPNGEIRQHKPIIYQEGDGVRQVVEGRYVLQADNRAAFEIAGYDTRRPLIIDPALTFGTYLGSPGEDVFGISAAASTATYPAVAVDAQGSVYITGYNGGTATNFTGNPSILTSPGPQAGGGVDAFVVKLNSAGTTLLYSVVFGGGLVDVGGGIAVDSQGNAYVTGNTNSTNFPITTGAPQTTLNGGNSAFVTKINASGTGIAYSTYLGGSGNFWGRAIAVDRSGNAYVTGTAQASGNPPFPLVNPISSTPSSGFLTEVNAAGNSFIYSTYLAAGIGYGVAVDTSGNAYVTGSTGGATTPSPAQGYVLKVNAGGTGTAYGPVNLGNSGTGLQTIGFGIAVDSQNNAYATGMTNDPHFPQLSNAAQGTFGGGLTDGFVVKLNPSGSLAYGSYLGGLGSNLIPERGSGIGVDQDGNTYVSGTTQCIKFPSVNSISGARNGSPVALAKGTISGSTSNWSATSLSGSFDQVTALAFDPSGNLYAGASAQNASGGGIYKQASGSSTWTQVSNGITTSTIDAIAVDPNATSTVYAVGGGHIYQTTNGGTNWTQLSQTVSTATPAVIAIAKTNPSTIYVGSSTGLIYSKNGGSSWSSPTTPPGTGAISALVVDPNNSQIAYAGTVSPSQTVPTGVYKTTNAGTVWNVASTGLPAGPGGTVTDLAITNSSSAVYAVVPNGLFFSTNGGAGWTEDTLGQIASTPVLVAVDASNNLFVAFKGAGIATGTSCTPQCTWSVLTYNGLTQNPIVALATPPTGSGTAYAGIVSATDAFLAQLSPSGAILSSTCIGGSDNNLGQNIAVTINGTVYVSGLTTATNFPVTSAAIQKTNAGLYDAFLTRVDNVPFTDVPANNAFFNFINVMYESGITGGCATNPPQYCPNSNTTRGEMAVFIITAMFGKNSFSYTTTPYFNDVPASNGFFKFIQKMADLGITSGCGSNDYCPNSPVTRAQMAVFIIVARYGTIPFTYPTTPYFTDVPASSPFFPFVQKMAQLGITSGCAIGLYCPDSSLTRGQMAVFIVTGLLDELLSTPMITEAVPNTGNTGQTVTVAISAIGTNFGAGTQVAVPTGITASNLTVLSPTSLTVQLNISPSAVPSLTATNGRPYTLAFTTGTSEADLSNGFIVQ